MYVIYIPLCFYFISCSKPLFSFISFNLHSTMLLLYQYNAHMLLYNCPNLHSTMLLLYLLKIISQVAFAFHLHSTMLLLYRLWCVKLYIFQIHLHSTMLLLYRRGVSWDSKRKKIYIPLCFYFIFTVLAEIPFTVTIYIPLCFYFIYLLNVNKRGCNRYLHSTMLLLYPQVRSHTRGTI